MAARFFFDGLDELVARLEDSGDDAPRELGRALNVEAEKIMTKSKRLVPVDLGVLRASGHVRKPVIKKTAATVVMGYGGAASAYALIQHERLDFQHTSGQAKFLEQPVKAAAAGLGRRLAKNLDLF